MFEASALAITPVLAFIAVGWLERSVNTHRVEVLRDQLKRSQPAVAIPGLQPDRLALALAGDMDRIQLFAAALAALPSVFLSFAAIRALSIFIDAVYVLLIIAIAINIGRQISNTRINALKARFEKSQAGKLVWRVIPIDTDRALLAFLILVFLFVVTFGADSVSAVVQAIAPAVSPNPLCTVSSSG